MSSPIALQLSVAIESGDKTGGPVQVAEQKVVWEQ